MMRFVPLGRAAEKIGCSVDDILEVAWPDEYNKPNFWICASIGEGDYAAVLVENNGEQVSKWMEMSVDRQYTVLRHCTIERIYNEGKCNIGYFVPSMDEFCNEDWTWWKLVPSKEIGIKDLVIESSELQKVCELLVRPVVGSLVRNTIAPELNASPSLAKERPSAKAKQEVVAHMKELLPNHQGTVARLYETMRAMAGGSSSPFVGSANKYDDLVTKADAKPKSLKTIQNYMAEITRNQ